MTVHPAFTAAERLAPEPQRRGDATRDQWIRVHAANALAAHTAFRAALKTLPPNPERGSRPDLGYLILIATSATAAVCAMTSRPDRFSDDLWALTPEAGALNGEYIDFLATMLDAYGINPMADRRIMFRLPLPSRDDQKFRFTPVTRDIRSKVAQEAAYDQAVRSRWRALLLIVKAKLEAVEAGIVTLESEFLAHILLPDGTTVYDQVAPRLAIAYSGGDVPALLPGASGVSDGY